MVRLLRPDSGGTAATMAFAGRSRDSDVDRGRPLGGKRIGPLPPRNWLRPGHRLAYSGAAEPDGTGNQSLRPYSHGGTLEEA